jgi:hypothetical protein
MESLDQEARTQISNPKSNPRFEIRNSKKRDSEMIREPTPTTSAKQLRKLRDLFWQRRYWLVGVVGLVTSAVWLPGYLFPDPFKQTFDHIEMGMTLIQVEEQIDPASYQIDASWERTIFNGSEHTWRSKDRLMVVRFTADGRAYAKDYGIMATNGSFLRRLQDWVREVAGRLGM